MNVDQSSASTPAACEAKPPFADIAYATPAIACDRREDGAAHLLCLTPLGPDNPSLARLSRAAVEVERPLAAERDSSESILPSAYHRRDGVELTAALNQYTDETRWQWVAADCGAPLSSSARRL